MKTRFIIGILTLGICLSVNQTGWAQSKADNRNPENGKVLISGPEAMVFKLKEQSADSRIAVHGSEVQVLKKETTGDTDASELRIEFDGPAPQTVKGRSVYATPKQK